jgi:hypothetical protein
MSRPLRVNSTVPITCGTCHNFFAIQGQNVPHYHAQHQHEPDYDPQQLLYGKMHMFYQVKMPGWLLNDRAHDIGKCTLWKPIRLAESSTLGLDVIDFSQELKYQNQHTRGARKLEFVPLQHLYSLIAVAPVITGWNDRLQSPRSKHKELLKRSTEYYILPLPL